MKKYAQMMKISDEIHKDTVALKNLILDFDMSLTHSIYKKGILIDKATMRFGYDAGDFMNNLVTVLMESRCVKVSRIISLVKPKFSDIKKRKIRYRSFKYPKLKVYYDTRSK